MPHVSLKVFGSALPAPVRQALHDGLTTLMADILKKDPVLTSVLLEALPAPAASWTVGGQPQEACAHLDARITAGTNSAEEKGAFIAAAMDLLRRHLGALPVATYVVVTELPADAWGYAGRTQAARHAARSVSIPAS